MNEYVFAGKRRFMWEYVGDTEIQTKSGRYLQVSVWEGECSHCGHPFRITGPLHCDDPKKNRNFGLRTCEEHRDPRRSAMGRKGFIAARSDGKNAT